MVGWFVGLFVGSIVGMIVRYFEGDPIVAVLGIAIKCSVQY